MQGRKGKELKEKLNEILALADQRQKHLLLLAQTSLELAQYIQPYLITTSIIEEVTKSHTHSFNYNKYAKNLNKIYF